MEELQSILGIVKTGGVGTLLTAGIWLVDRHYKGRIKQLEARESGLIRLLLKTMQLAHPVAYKQALDELAQERVATGGS